MNVVMKISVQIKIVFGMSILKITYYFRRKKQVKLLKYVQYRNDMYKIS